MSSQGFLFDKGRGQGAYGQPLDDRPSPPPPLPHNGTPTSEAAAHRAAFRAGSDAERILRFAREKGGEGFTCWEVECALSIAHQTAGARIKGLRDRALIARTDRTRPTNTGSPAAVYVAAEFAPRGS